MRFRKIREIVDSKKFDFDIIQNSVVMYMTKKKFTDVEWLYIFIKKWQRKSEYILWPVTRTITRRFRTLPNWYREVRSFSNCHYPQRCKGRAGNQDRHLNYWAPQDHKTSHHVTSSVRGFVKDKVFVPDDSEYASKSAHYIWNVLYVYCTF